MSGSAGMTSPFLLLQLLAFSYFVAASVPVRLCVTSINEYRKCSTFPGIVCVLGNDANDCMKKIVENNADLTSLDGGNVYIAGKCHSLKPVMNEISASMPNGGGYYAVAVANQESDITINNLAGKKSCHTGVNKTAGWFIPMSILFSNKTDQLGQASAFFSESCVPGAVPDSNMCRLCTPNCNRSSDNRFYGYNGAAKCLIETDADVAFVKHLTFLNDPGKNRYKLLCKDGTTSSIDNFLNCHLAKTPSHAVVGKSTLTANQTRGIYEKFQQIDSNLLFSNARGKNLIFSSSTKSLSPVFVKYDAFLGADYLRALPPKAC